MLAGGFNLDGTSAVADWQIAHPAPANARPDATTHTYHPIADLVRVVSSEPKTDLSGRTIQVQGVVAPGTTDRPIEAYAYCAAGLSHVPQIVVAEGTANYVTGGPGGRNFLTMTCPAGTVIAGAGYTDFSFDDGSGKAYMPVYSGFPERDKWIVAPDQLPMYDTRTMTDVSYDGTLVCVSSQDFTVVTSPRGDFTLPFDATVATAATLGDDTAYWLAHHEASSCPAGSLLLPPGFDFAETLGRLDLRLDADFVELGLDGWSLDVSTGGGITYPTGALFADGPTVFVRCLQPV